MTQEEAKQFAEQEFRKMDDTNYEWNILHAKYMIRALKELAKVKKFDLEKLKVLAYVHDIGKVKDDTNHAVLSVEILKEKFKLDEIDIDCITNHGSFGKPVSEEAKAFQTADGISLFYPETLFFRFFAGAKEGLTYDGIKQRIRSQYAKYLGSYKESPEAVEILKGKGEGIFEE